MIIAGVQFKPELNNKEINEDKILNLMNDIKSDIIIFPELATTGYSFFKKEELLPLCEPFPGDFSNQVQSFASEKNKIIIYGFAEIDNLKIFNSAAIIFPKKEYSTVYRKTHLFFKEFYCFEKGDTGFFVIKYPDWDLNLGTMICYDWRFPESARTLALKGADLIVCPSNLVTHLWGKVMPARAIENKVYIAVINRIGTEIKDDQSLFFNGESVVLGYNGERLAKANVEEESVIYADIEPKSTRNKSFNEFNDIFKDRRPDLYL